MSSVDGFDGHSLRSKILHLRDAFFAPADAPSYDELLAVFVMRIKSPAGLAPSLHFGMTPSATVLEPRLTYSLVSFSSYLAIFGIKLTEFDTLHGQ